MEDKHLGIYVHIPFCASKCGYCDFYSLAGRDNRMPRYQQALLQHIEEAAGVMAPYYIDTLYFGGGTPSYYGGKRIAELLNAFKQAGKVLKSSEITVECNPDSVTRRDLRILADEGVNRISLGVQSDNDDLLKIIGRRHNFAQVIKAVQDIRNEDFDNLSMDLIYGLPNQSKRDWAETLGRTLDLGPDHISCYGLKLEEGTPMYGQYKNSPVLPSDDDQADMYLFAVETLEHYGYAQYEISNFARKGKESRHNMKYWDLDDYLGFGPGAHSCIGNTRYSFVRSMQAYIAGMNGGKDILDEYEVLSPLDRAAEYVMLGLRRTKGICKEEYYNIYKSDFTPMEELFKEFQQDGWAKFTDGRWSFTSTGFLLSNTLIGSLLEAQAEYKLSGNPWMKEPYKLNVEKINLPTGGDVH
jgi:putative oxygen-independent coproporphyrinogen III oxidase